LALDLVPAAVLVGEANVDARLPRAALDRARVDLDLLERQQLAAVPQAADTDVELVAQVDAHGVEPEVVADLARQVGPAVELGPIALAAPGVVAVPDAVEGMRDAAEGHRSRHAPALLDVSRELVARRRRVFVRRAHGVPSQIEGGRARRVAQPEALQRSFDLEAEARDLEGVALERRRGRAMLGDGVHDGALVGDEEVEVRVTPAHVHAGTEHDADLARRVVHGKPVALAPQRQRRRTRVVATVVLRCRHVDRARHAHSSRPSRLMSSSCTMSNVRSPLMRSLPSMKACSRSSVPACTARQSAASASRVASGSSTAPACREPSVPRTTTYQSPPPAPESLNWRRTGASASRRPTLVVSRSSPGGGSSSRRAGAWVQTWWASQSGAGREAPMARIRRATRASTTP